MTQAAVAFRDVSIVFGPRPAGALALLDAGGTRDAILADTGHVIGVASATLAVQPGTICVLMGLSGSGKSTLLRAVNGLNRVSRGEVWVRHGGAPVDVARCPPGTLRALRSGSVAMVFQQFALLPWRTVRENVGLGLELRGTPKAELRRVVDEKLAMVGLSAWADKQAHELSGGMQQRVGLARAFSTDADILLMDEPFSALDPLIRTKLQDELLALQATLRKTILFVSHDLDEAIKLGNQVVIMEGGHIIQAGSPQDIVLRPATPYVADFVRHMNPLGALRAADVMRPLAAVARDGDALLPDGDALRVALDPQGRPAGCTRGGVAVPLSSLDETVAPETTAPGVVLIPAGLALRELVRARHSHRCPIVVVDPDGRAVGVVGENEILRGLSRA